MDDNFGVLRDAAVIGALIGLVGIILGIWANKNKNKADSELTTAQATSEILNSTMAGIRDNQATLEAQVDRLSKTVKYLESRNRTLQDEYDRLLWLVNSSTNRLRLLAIIDHIHEGVLIETEQGNVAYLNQELLDLFGIPGKPSDYLGTSVVEYFPKLAKNVDDPQAFVQEALAIIARGLDIFDEPVELKDLTIYRTYLNLRHGDGTVEPVWIHSRTRRKT